MTAAAAAMLKHTRMTILLSLNAVAVLVAGILIANAIGLNENVEFSVVAERSDVSEEKEEGVALLDPVLEVTEGKVDLGSGLGGSGSGGNSGGSGGSGGGTGGYVPPSGGGDGGGGSVPAGELWSETAITIYQTANIDICVDNSLGGLGSMYWQTSNTGVIGAFYAEARTRLGYSTEKCRYPKITGTGTTTITAGTYDGQRRDTLIVTVIAPPVEQWKREVLTLVNKERAKAGVAALSWGTTCEAAAQLRAREIKTNYSHTRPNGASWATACPAPASGGTAGENLAAGNTAVSPATVVASWMGSADHKANILNAKFTRLSVGFEFDANAQYRTYWSQIFSTY
jgi:uncharacterized protein YkwD